MISKRQEETRRATAEKLSCFLNFGGLIQEAAMEGIMELYPDQVIDVILDDDEFQVSDLMIAERLEELAKRYPSLLGRTVMDFLEDEPEDSELDGNEAYAAWFLKKAYHYEKEQRRSQSKPFWNDYRLGRKEKKILAKLSAFEEHLLFLMKGIDIGCERSAEEVADLPEFSAERNMVRRHCRWVEMFLRTENLDMEHFSGQCVPGRESMD